MILNKFFISRLFSTLFISAIAIYTQNNYLSAQQLNSGKIDNSEVKFLTPSSVELFSEGRFKSRFDGNINYLK